jgi:uncharacterized protein YjaG (DUF416 family)
MEVGNRKCNFEDFVARFLELMGSADDVGELVKGCGVSVGVGIIDGLDACRMLSEVIGHQLDFDAEVSSTDMNRVEVSGALFARNRKAKNELTWK